MSAHAGALEAVERILNRGGEPEAVLGAVAAALHGRGFAWVAIGAVEAGERPEEPSLRTPVAWRGVEVGELRAEPNDPSPHHGPLLERVALLVSAHVAAAAGRAPDPSAPDDADGRAAT